MLYICMLYIYTLQTRKFPILSDILPMATQGVSSPFLILPDI